MDDPLAELTADERKALAEIAKARANEEMSRRDMLKGLGILGAGAAVGGGGMAATQPAEAQTVGDGATIGASDDRWDAWFEDVDAQSVNTEELNTIIEAGSYGDGTIQAALDAVTQKQQGAFVTQAIETVHVPPSDPNWSEQITISKPHQAVESRSAQGVLIESDGGSATVLVQNNDARIENIGANHTGTGTSSPAFKAEADPGGTTTDEITFINCSTDQAESHGFQILADVPHCYLSGCESSAGTAGAALFVDADYTRVESFKAQNPPNVGIFWSNGSYGQFDGVIQQPSGYGFKLGLGATFNKVGAEIETPDGDGLIVEGDNNIAKVTVDSPTGNSLTISGSGNEITIVTNDVVVIQSGAADNVISGVCAGITDNTSGANDTSDLTDTTA